MQVNFLIVKICVNCFNQKPSKLFGMIWTSYSIFDSPHNWPINLITRIDQGVIYLLKPCPRVWRFPIL